MTPTEVFSCQFCKISKSTYCILILKVSEFYKKHWERWRRHCKPNWNSPYMWTCYVQILVGCWKTFIVKHFTRKTSVWKQESQNKNHEQFFISFDFGLSIYVFTKELFVILFTCGNEVWINEGKSWVHTHKKIKNMKIVMLTTY